MQETARTYSETPQESFPCLIPAIPLDSPQRIGHALTSAATGPVYFREAHVDFAEGELRMSARKTDGSKTALGAITVTDASAALLKPIPEYTPFGAALVRPMFIGPLVGMAIARLLLGSNNVVGFALIFGVVLTIFFAVLFKSFPALLESGSHFHVVQIRTKNGSTLVFALKPDQLPAANAVLSRAGLTVEEIQQNR